MSSVNKSIASLGNAVLSGQMTPATAEHFVYQQIEKWTGQINAVASQASIISMRVVPIGDKARRDYSYPQTPGDYTTYNIPWNGTQAQVASDLATAVNAANPYITVTATSGGAFTIETKDGSTNYYGLQIEFGMLHLITVSKVNVAVDLTTWTGEAILQASVSGGEIALLETGVAPTAGSGLLIPDGSPFDIVGVTNIINAMVIDTGAATTVDYQIYMG